VDTDAEKIPYEKQIEQLEAEIETLKKKNRTQAIELNEKVEIIASLRNRTMTEMASKLDSTQYTVPQVSQNYAKKTDFKLDEGEMPTSPDGSFLTNPKSSYDTEENIDPSSDLGPPPAPNIPPPPNFSLSPPLPPGGPPPPPMPKRYSRAPLRAYMREPKVKMKQVQWAKLEYSKIKGTIFENFAENLNTITLDYDELENQFCAKTIVPKVSGNFSSH
jgi:dishevelled associated activator of morphogenesis